MQQAALVGTERLHLVQDLVVAGLLLALEKGEAVIFDSVVGQVGDRVRGRGREGQLGRASLVLEGVSQSLVPRVVSGCLGLGLWGRGSRFTLCFDGPEVGSQRGLAGLWVGVGQLVAVQGFQRPDGLVPSSGMSFMVSAIELDGAAVAADDRSFHHFFV